MIAVLMKLLEKTSYRPISQNDILFCGTNQYCCCVLFIKPLASDCVSKSVDLRAFSGWSYTNTTLKKGSYNWAWWTMWRFEAIKCPTFDPITLVFDILFIFFLLCPKKTRTNSNKRFFLFWALKQVCWFSLLLFFKQATRHYIGLVNFVLRRLASWRQ